MTGPIPNVDLLRRTLAYIEEHPEEWNQRAWRCGTTACFAGHAVILEGGRWADPLFDDLIARDDDPEEHQMYVGAGEPKLVEVKDRAQRILGLTEEQADYLFNACNRLTDLRRIVAELTGGAS